MKRKQEVVVDLEQQLAAHKALEHDDLKRRRQNDTKAWTNKRAVKISDQTPFPTPAK